MAAHVGDPTMVDPTPVTATDVVRKVTSSLIGGDNKVTVETVNGNAVPNQEAPRSDTPTASADQAATAPAAQDAAAELKPNDPGELKPNVDTDANALPPLQQSNQLDSGNGTSSAVSSSGATKSEEMADISSSKKKKKKGLGKLNPF
jgi:outer membrane protein assembly factor BamD